MRSNSISLLFIALAGLFVLSQKANAQVHSPTSAHTTYTGTSMTGYQGWFGTPGDGGTNGWRHYNGKDGFKPGSASIEYWPDMREADEDEKYITSFTKSDGSPCYVFSSVHPKTVSRHFQWMKEYGIDGAFMQRFRSDWGLRPTMNKILGNALAAAREHDRAISLMYDIGANIHVGGVPNDALRTEEVNKIFGDWKALIDELGLTTGGDDQPYLYHDGKPLIVLWGVGFNHRHNTTGLDMKYWEELVDSLQNSPDYGGCAIMLGVPTNWRLGGGDCISGSEHDRMIELIKRIEIVQPWHTSRYRRDQMATDFKNMVTSDVNWCQTNGVAYTPTVSPGIREKILHGNDYEKEREGGYYFWDMARAAIEAGSEMLYLGMFDEVDEGTQYHKIDNNPPFYSSSLSFASYEGLPEDHYLWLAGEATRALRGEFTMGSTYRTRAGDSDFQSVLVFNDLGSDYEMSLATPAPGRKLYYADPYKVPDGAPTVGTQRNASLFSNELSDQTVTFLETQRGLFIRFVEVDEMTDEIISYKALVATHGYAMVPYVTSFEEGSLDLVNWTISTESSVGRVEVIDTQEPRTGKYHLGIDVSEDGAYVISSADLHLNLGGILTELILEFSFKHFGDDVNVEDGVFFSDDGGVNFTKVCDFQGVTGTYKDTAINLSKVAASHGLQHSEKFVIRFQHKDIQLIPEAGLVIDDIRILHSGEKGGYAQFVEMEESTQGSWMGVYGEDGHIIVEKESDLPEYASISWDPRSESVIWEDSSSDIRGLQFKQDTTILAAQYAENEDHPWWFSVDVGEEEQQVSLYFLDGDSLDRKFILELSDFATGDIYDIQTIGNFEGGLWYTWKIRGKVRFLMDLLGGPNATVSGIFFSPSTPSEIEVSHHLSFDGVDDYVDCGRNDALLISSSEITLEAWFKLEGTKDAIYQSTILAMDHGESGNDVGYFLRANGDGQVEWGFGDGSWHQVKSEDGVQLFEPHTWNHVAGVYDGSYQKIYVNGNLVSTSDAFTATIEPVPTESLYLGSAPGFAGRVIEAGLTELRIWDVARTDAEIKEYATKRITGTEVGLAAYWPINEGEGQRIADLSQNGNEGILGGKVEESLLDPAWKREKLISSLDIMEGFNGSFEDEFTSWRFYEVPDPLGSRSEIIQGDVIHGANAAKITYVEATDALGDRSLDTWDSNMPLVPGQEYDAKFWAKTDRPGDGVLKVTYGFFDQNRAVIGESGVKFELTGEYEEYSFDFIAPPGTAKGWLAFRWKDDVDDVFLPGVVYMDYVQLWTLENKPVESIDISADTDSIEIDELIKLNSSVFPEDATEIGISWSLSSSLDSAIVSIDSRGFITGLASGTATAVATAVDGSGVIGTFDIHVRGPLGRKVLSTMHISLYPNPTSGTLNIETDQGHCSYSIWTILGQAVHQGEFNGNAHLQIGSLVPGLYFIEIESGEAHKIMRFIKQ